MTKVASYRQLNAAQLAASLTQLEARIRERFPEAGLALVCDEVLKITRENTARVAAIGRRDWWLWAGIAAFVAGSLYGLTKLRQVIDLTKAATNPDSLYTLVQSIDAAIHLVVVTGGAIFFLITMENRLKRRRALKALNELRSIIHVIDMHQLTKEPAAILAGGTPTQHSPKRTLTAFELGRYLDYCSEMLSLVAKVAVLYVQHQPDPVLIDAVSDLERLTTNLSQKIWQKIILVHSGPDGFDLQASHVSQTAQSSQASHAVNVSLLAPEAQS